MPAHFIPIGDPAHDAERQALRYLVDGLPPTYTVFGNAWIVERSGVVYELDAVVVAPHALYVVEIKSYRGRIDGTDHDWYVPDHVPSPLKKNRLTAQVLKSQLKHESYQAGQVWVQGFLFLSATTDVGVRGPASTDRVHSRSRILAALQDEPLAQRLSGRTDLPPTAPALSDLLKLLTGAPHKGPRPVRRVREYEILDTRDHQDTFTELLGRNALSGVDRLLRIYTIPPLATDAQRDRIAERARWEAQVLARLGKSDGIQAADPPFSDEAGIVLPLEHFPGITLATWLEKYGPAAKSALPKADLRARTDLWIRIASTLDDAHRQGVVHRLLRPDVILVDDAPAPDALRVTGFDLAKQLALDTTVALTSLADERLLFAAPEVVTAFSSAEPASDQFSLGALLGLLLTGRPLFDSTRQLMAQRRLLMRVRDIAQRVPLSLDEAVTRMLALRPTDRYPSLAAAIDAVRLGRDPSARPLPHLDLAPRAPLDPDNLDPGVRIGADYEITGPLGQGGMAIVYAARHIISGKTRALKIAKSDHAAEAALASEYEALSTLDHPNIVRVIDLSKMVEGRLTLVMERVGGENLRQWLAHTPDRPPATQRRLAEDLLAGLDYLEQQGLTHKDLKPDNLLVSDSHLTLIDFSLAGLPDDALYGGTALYRDPATLRWSHATDRFAAALCLFELYAGRHAFDGHVPEPGQPPAVSPDDIDPPGLAAFFHKALNPLPDLRFPSARAMRDALVVALGDPAAPTPATSTARLDAATQLRLTDLSPRAVNALARTQVHTVGDLLALPPAHVRTIHAIGTKTAAGILAFQAALRARGLASTAPAASHPAEPPLVPDLCASPEPVARLALSPPLLAALAERGLPTVGAVANLSRAALLAIPGIGRARLAEVVDALHQFHSATPRHDAPHTLDRLWDLAARPLTPRQRTALEHVFGLHGDAPPDTQGDIARALGVSQSQLSTDASAALERLDVAALGDLAQALDTFLDGLGGIVRLDDLAARFEDQWPASLVTGAGVVRLLVRIAAGRTHLVVDVNGVDGPLVARSRFDRDTVRAFAAELTRLASQWPPIEPETARRTLSALLPHHDGDPLALGVQLCTDISLTDGGHLFIPPIDPRHSIAFVLDQLRDPLPLADLQRRVLRTFGEATPYPAPDHLLALLGDLDARVHDDQVIPGRTGSVLAVPALTPDAPPVPHGTERTPEAVVRDMLQDAATSRGFRMLVTPPERHPELARSVATALGATWVSFEDAFFADHAADLRALERAERFAAQRDALTEAAEATLFRLLDHHGRPGHTIVLGDTPLFALCEALDLPRRLYDETLSGSRGFWILVVPGVIHNRQPRFNEGPAMWHLEGATLPLLNPLPPPGQTPPGRCT